MCVNKCAAYARVENNVVTKLDPNPHFPKSKNMLCARGNAGIQAIYDPDTKKVWLNRTYRIYDDPSFSRKIKDIPTEVRAGVEHYLRTQLKIPEDKMEGAIKKLAINLDNDPHKNSRRTQFINRMQKFSTGNRSF